MSCQTADTLGTLPLHHRHGILAIAVPQPVKDLINQPMRPVLSSSEADPGLLIVYDPDASYAFWACWEAEQAPANRLHQPPVGHGHTQQEAIDCLYALMAWWCLRSARPPMPDSLQDPTA
jgi:hypothetical protein